MQVNGISIEDAREVSIRTRPFGRVMLVYAEGKIISFEFQSAPGLSAG